ncbi:hypothetical protein ACFSJU_14050 [Paradesertivirga mongoliensis]|uniref:Thioredoxin domain-containing protein n=1 Tax=Paradesertivirga mongoliensis TaxID=2100740 RepID=A0ABW4ZPI0_9SPHI|nr:hypothetical protein [Pedobacter mongoliensis]
MKSILYVSLFAFSISNVIAQGIRFEKDSVETLIIKSKQISKPVMILVDGPSPAKSSEAARQRKFLNKPELVKIYEQNFLNLKADYGSPLSQRLATEYKITRYPAFVFLSNGIEVHKSFGYLGDEKKYLSLATTVLKMIESQQNMAAYKMRYDAGDRTKPLIMRYIKSRIRLGYYDNSDLINEYIQHLTLAEINQFKEMLFIIEAGPVAGSQALQLSHMYKQLRDSIYRTIPKSLAIAINNRTIKNSLDRAIAKKDHNLAQQAASFASASHGADYKRGQRSYQSNMLVFQRSIKDTSSYFRAAGYFYDQYYMSLGVDSAQRRHKRHLDSLKLVRKQLERKKTDSLSLVYRISHMANPTAVELNRAAWQHYLTGTKNPDHLLKAISWSRRSLAIEPAYYTHDTQAHLLYRLGFYAEAEYEQRKAIKLAKEKKMSSQTIKRLNSELHKITSKTL